MKTTVEMAKEAGFTWEPINNIIGPLERFEALVRADERALAAPVQEPEIVQRVKRYAGQTMRTARNPNITARECIELANWLAANTTTPPAAPAREDWGPGPHEVHSLPPAAQQEYERGVIDGRQMQAQSSVDKAVNAMSQRQWVGLTDEEILEAAGIDGADTWLFETAYAIEAKLKEKNT